MSADQGHVLAAIANRVSRVQGRSIPEQDAENRAACQERGWGVFGVYQEAGSASRFARKNREEWARLLRDLEAGCFGVVVLWESSRGDRTLASWIKFLDLCMARGVLVHVSSEDRTYDLTKSSDYSSLAQAGINNRDESERTSKRVNRTVRARAAQGKAHGRIPFGYRREYEFVPDPTTGRQIRVFRQLHHEERAGLIREMAERTLANEPLYSVARELNERGCPTPTGRPWDLTRIRQILLNPTIAGLRVFQGKILEDVEAEWEPIISRETRDLLVAKLTDPKRRTYVDGSVKHLLVGIAVCGVCGATVKRAKNRGTPSYQCPKGFCVARKMEFVDEFVTELVIARLSQPDAADLLHDADDGEATRQREKLVALRARLDAHYVEAAEGELSARGLVEVEKRLVPQIEAAEKLVKARESAPLVVRQLVRAEDVAARWDGLLVPQRRETVRWLLTPVIKKTNKVKSLDGVGVDWKRGEPV